MKLFKVVGKNKKTVKLAEEFLKKIDFEKKMKEICFEVLAFDIPFKETMAYQKYIKELGLKPKAK